MRLVSLVIALALLGLQTHRATASEGLQVRTFSIEITPPLGQPVGQGFIPILKTAEHPLLARGIILKDSGLKCVICTLDLMEVHNSSFEFLRQTIAEAAVSRARVALHCLHQLMIEAGPARVWGLVSPNVAFILGLIQEPATFHPLDPSSPQSQIVYVMTSRY